LPTDRRELRTGTKVSWLRRTVDAFPSARGAYDIGALEPEQRGENVQHVRSVFNDKDGEALESYRNTLYQRDKSLVPTPSGNCDNVF
jgi:hypothetical protein